MFRRKKSSGEHGSITVLVTLILVPTIFVNCFLVDLARLKLYGNQAVMTADNYGESVLTVYNYLLKELYGLFAVSDSDEGKAAIELLGEYAKTSFDPNKSTISRPHLSIVTGETDYSGFMPYDGVNIELSYASCAEANLRNLPIFSTQIGDFMKFRIVKALGDESSAILDAVTRVKGKHEDSKTIEKKRDLDDALGELLNEISKYYKLLKKFKDFPAYTQTLTRAYGEAKRSFDSIADSELYRNWVNYRDHKDEIEDALDRLEDDEPHEEDGELLAIYDALDGSPKEHKKKLENKFADEITYFKSWINSSEINYDNYEKQAKELKSIAARVRSRYQSAASKRSELEASLGSPNVSDELKSGIKTDLEQFDKIFEPPITENTYSECANYIYGQKDFVSDQAERLDRIVNSLNDRAQDLVDGPEDKAASFAKGLESDYDYFYDAPTYKALYDNLDKIFDSSGGKGSSAKKDAAEKATKAAEDELNKPETSDARDIPAGIDIGRSGDAASFRAADMLSGAASLLGANSLGDAANSLLLKFYTVVYDFNMFSNRTTNIKEDREPEESLTGYELCDKLNYLYKAELEYLFGGFKSSDANLNEARNYILTFRMVVNYTASYSIQPVNDAIRAIQNATSAAATPLVGILVGAALRLAFATVETASDWKLLKEGESVVLTKKEIKDITSGDALSELLSDGEISVDLGDADEKGDSSGFSLSYEQYLLVMLVFMTTKDQIASRTADLIELNVNTVMQELDSGEELSELEFKLENAVTAVDATCTVQLDFTVMPDRFAKMMLEGPAYALMQASSKNKYAFRVTRGY